MPPIPDEEIDRLKRQTDLAALVRSRGVELRKHGSRDLIGRCPFHDDKEPSFVVTPEKGLFHCLGCGAAGNAIQFVERFDGVSFRHAFEILNDGPAAFTVPARHATRSVAGGLAQLEGQWAGDGGVVLQFLGDGIGKENARYFKYSLADDQLTLDYGAGETTVYTVSLVDGKLTLSEDENEDPPSPDGLRRTGEYEPLSLPPCVINLHKLNAAKQLFEKDEGDRMPSLSDLMVYLPILPQCPDGGIYTINAPGTPPRCSVPEHALDD